MKKLFLVTFDGHNDEYGSEIYLIGIYSSREKAEEACKKAVAEMEAIHRANSSDEYDAEAHEPTIDEVELDESKSIHGGKYKFITDVYLGGYAE